MAAASSEADKYEVLEKIGHGSFGIIRKVKRKADGKILCRKEINYVKMSAREREQLAAEFNILNSLRHESIVGYYHRDHLRDQQEVHLYMEYCGGGDLASKIKEFNRKKEHPSEEYVWDVIGQLSSALYRCHNGEIAPAVRGNILGPPASPRGLRSKTQVCILHRDLKPENIFLGDDDSVKLGDFGLSKAISQHDFASTYVGTPYYMSPEICASEKYGWHSDVWALGCIIYELCAGRPPFDAKTHFNLMQKIKECRYDPLPNVYSKELQDLVGRCLQLNPSKRPTTFQIINIPVVRIMRKQRELVAVTKAIEVQKAQAAQRLADAAAKNVALQTLVTQSEADRKSLIEKVRQETVEATRTEIDASLRREWEVKAQLEISKHCKAESERLQQIFDSELEKRVALEVAAQIEIYKKVSKERQTGTKVDTPPSSDLSRLSFDSPMGQASQTSQVPSLKKPSRTPFARAQTQVMATQSPMDIQMTSPSPMYASLSLSPRRTAALAGNVVPMAPASLFSNQAAAKERWQPQLAYNSDSEEDDEDEAEIPEAPSPMPVRGQQRVLGVVNGGDPFKTAGPAGTRPGARRQNTMPINAASSGPGVFTSGSTATSSLLPTPTSPTRRPNRFLTKAVTTAAANAASGSAPTGRTLVELNQARVANLSNIPVSQVSSGTNSHASSVENHLGSNNSSCNSKDEGVAVWDPEVEMEMPSPFLARRGRGILS